MQPAANVGGPLVIPKLYNGRNRTFFFFGYQKLIEKKTQAYTSQTPSPDMLAGDFTCSPTAQLLIWVPIMDRGAPTGWIQTSIQVM